MNKSDTNGRILSAAYNETGGFNRNYFPVYDNYGNIIACKLDDGDMAKAVLINPNNGAIDTRYDPNDIYDPFSYRARDGFIGIGPLWANNDDGTVYMQGHVVISNPWGNVSTNGTTTTTTDDTTDKDGGDDAEPCWDPDAPFENCMANCYEEKTGRDGSGWRRDLDKIDEYAGIVNELFNRGFEAFVGIAIQIITIYVSWILKLSLKALIALGVSLELFDQYVDSLKNKTTKELKERRDEMLKEDSWLSDGYYCEKLLNAMGDCYDICKQYIVEVD